VRPTDLVLTENARDDDTRSLRRIAAGDAEALGELYDRYGRVAFGVLRRMLGSPEVAEEIVQDAFHAVWLRARDYRPERGSVRTWLLAICRNAAIDWWRTKGKRAAREVAVRDLDAGPEMPVEERAIATLRAEGVRVALASLPLEQRQVIALAYWGGLSQREIAQRVDAPIGTVKSRVRLAMAKLRQRLASEAGGGK